MNSPRLRAFLQRRKAKGIILLMPAMESPDGEVMVFSGSKSPTYPSSTTQSIWAVGYLERRSQTTGKLCKTSPKEDNLTIKIFMDAIFAQSITEVGFFINLSSKD